MAINMKQLAQRYSTAAQKDVTSKELATLAQAGVGHVKREIQAMHAVDTGTMVNSTAAEKVGKDSYLIGPTVDYATYVALGTSRVAARPFHLTAMAKLNQDIAALKIDADKLGI